MSELEVLLPAFVKSFQAGLVDEIRAAQAREQRGKVRVTRPRQLSWDAAKQVGVYELDLLDTAHWVAAGLGCTLLLGADQHQVTIRALEGQAITLVTPVALSTDAVLIHDPSFLLQLLSDALAKLGPTTHELAPAFRLFGKLPASSTAAPLQGEYPELNESQRRAVQRCDASNLTFLWGPPGTGKTVTLACIVSEQLGRGRRVLVTANTHAALDQALEKIAAMAELVPLVKSGAVVRLGRSESDAATGTLGHDQPAVTGANTVRQRLERRQKSVGQLHAALSDLKQRLERGARSSQQDLFRREQPPVPGLAEWRAAFPHIDLCLARSRDAQQLAHRLERRLSRLSALSALYQRKRELLAEAEPTRSLSKARLVLTTLASTCTLPSLADERFDVVIFEEASMATLPSLFYGACFSTDKIIVVGDPRQLPPIVQSDSTLVRRTLGRTIFDVTVPDPHRSALVSMLDTQYRMHPAIGDLVSRLYYDGTLKNGDVASTTAIAERAPYPGWPLVLLDTAGASECQVEPSSGSRSNLATAERSVELAKEAIESGASSVGIITPYVAQARQVQNILRQRRLGAQVECSTVHRFQGQERDVIILDTVDTDPAPPGRLLTGNRDRAAECLLNVSVSRARGKLIVLADVPYFERRAPDSAITKLLRSIALSGYVASFERSSKAISSRLGTRQ